MIQIVIMYSTNSELSIRHDSSEKGTVAFETSVTIYLPLPPLLLLLLFPLSVFSLFFSFSSIQSLQVGLLDADVFGPSIPRLMNLSGQPELTKR